jgi:hypothetical protein
MSIKSCPFRAEMMGGCVAAGRRPAVMKVAPLSGRRQLSKTLNNKKYREQLPRPNLANRQINHFIQPKQLKLPKLTNSRNTTDRQFTQKKKLQGEGKILVESGELIVES